MDHDLPILYKFYADPMTIMFIYGQKNFYGRE